MGAYAIPPVRLDAVESVASEPRPAPPQAVSPTAPAPVVKTESGGDASLRSRQERRQQDTLELGGEEIPILVKFVPKLKEYEFRLMGSESEEDQGVDLKA